MLDSIIVVQLERDRMDRTPKALVVAAGTLNHTVPP